MFLNFLASHKNSKPFWKYNSQSGFGLIELMVSISIMVLVSGVILSRQSNFNSTILLRSEAYDIALRLREIQLNAVSASSGGDGEFRSILGVHFDKADDGKYYVFRDGSGVTDPDPDGFYQPDEQFDIQGVLDNRFEIRNIRDIGVITTERDQVSIIFVRPNFDARFFSSPGDSGEFAGNTLEIVIGERNKPTERTIEVTATGQISVF
jgi:prepilin-type N-terminal cleavage/methylation domain-containing protein